MLRVVTLSTLYPDATRPGFGGFVERQTRGLATLADVEVTVVAPVGLPPGPLANIGRYAPLSTLPRVETWNGLTVHRPRFVNLAGTGGRFHVAMLARAVAPLLRRLQAERGFDVIDAQFFFPDGPAAVALGRRFGVPVSIKARGGDIHGWGAAPAIRPALVTAARAADGLLAVSGELRDDMIAMGMQGERIAVHRTGNDRDRFRPRDRAPLKAALGVAGPLVASVGTLNANKGHAVVIAAMRRLPGVTLLIAGDGPDRAALAAAIANAGLGDRVRLLGRLSHDETADLLAAADVMALASAAEGLANVWVESLASGTPIVITAAGGAHEVIAGPGAGRIAARTPEAFAAAIAALLADPHAQDAVAAMAARFDWDVNAAELRDHLARLVAG